MTYMHFNTSIGSLSSLEVVRHIGHALHASGNHDLLLSSHQVLRGQHDGLHAAGTHLVDGGAGGAEGQAWGEITVISL